MSTFIPLRGSTPPGFAGSTLIYPQPSLASLAQLAADLLLWNAQGEWQLVGYLGLADFVPAVGGRDSLPGSSPPEGFAYGTEVYRLKAGDADLTLVLPRAPVIVARRAHHLAALKDWVQKEGFKELLLVAGVDAGLRGDEALMSTTPLRHFLLPSSSPSTLSQRLSTLFPPYVSTPSTSSTALPLFPHGGLTRKLLSAFSPSSEGQSGVNVAALTIYTAEGDALPSAYILAEALAAAVGLPLQGGEELEGKVEQLQLSEGEEQGPMQRQWKTPKSWERGLMGVELGRDVGAEMYG
ncbi:hypothetical protein JCM10213_002907 [Rhodosporidiobolus nylandii]